KDGRAEINTQELETCSVREVPRQCGDFFFAQINEQSFREHKNFLGTAVERGKKGSARVGIRQIQTNAFQRTGRLFFCENLFFVREDFRQIDLDPLQRRRQFQAVWPRIETRGKVQHQVRALLQLLFDEMV